MIHNESQSNTSSITLSNFFGYFSILCWFVVFVPQIYTNYRTKNASSVSLTFLLLWLIGDLLNLIGAIIEGLLFTTILQGLYFAAADLFLMFQIWYYKPIALKADDFEESVAYLTTLRLMNTSKTKKVDQKRKIIKLIKVTILISVSIGTLFACYFLLRSPQVQTSEMETSANPNINPSLKSSTFAQFLGWISALLYWLSRVPQILKNHARKSVEGLSLNMFLFCVLGNVAFAASVFSHSLEYDFILKNVPWLLASGGTALIDFIIFGQFYMYKCLKLKPQNLNS